MSPGHEAGGAQHASTGGGGRGGPTVTSLAKAFLELDVWAPDPRGTQRGHEQSQGRRARGRSMPEGGRGTSSCNPFPCSGFAYLEPLVGKRNEK